MLLKFLLFVIFFYLFFRLLARFILPWLVRRYVNNAKKKFYEQNHNYDQQKKKRNEGEINVETKNQQSSAGKEGKDKLGDYVDFEEVDDE
ncbi:MAG: DUF4834 family protein [Bacteroidales bacterium]